MHSTEPSATNRANDQHARPTRSRLWSDHEAGWWGRVVVGALVGAICVTGSAVAQSVQFAFTGRGWGHGVGMSQYGAEGDAVHGWNAAKIMAWYYRGTTLGKASTASTIRVLLSTGQSQVTIGVAGSGKLIDTTTGHAVALAAGAKYLVRPDGAGITVTGPSGAVVATARDSVRISPTGSGLAVLESRTYHGILTITPASGRLTTINTVPIESYVRGVVAWEMPSRWAPAALQAQAIAARSYALASREPARAFDVYPDTRSQMYGGVAAETARTNTAVSTTSGTVVTYHGAVVATPFFSSSGGHTENGQNVWGGTALPYLVGVPDPYDTGSPMDPWPRPPSFSDTQLGQSLGLSGPVSGIVVVKRGASPRVLVARVTLVSGTSVTLSGRTIATDLGLRSTWFSVTPTSAGGGSGPAVSRAHIATYVVTHYTYARWRHAAAVLSADASRNPRAVARMLARGANARVSAAQITAFVSGHFAPAKRAAAMRVISALPASRQGQVLARWVFAA